jgi:hypothetical protein
MLTGERCQSGIIQLPVFIHFGLTDSNPEVSWGKTTKFIILKGHFWFFLKV